jgi:hypothetical protein
MLRSIDRIQIATPDAHATAQGWRALLGAEVASTDHVQVLAAKRTTLRLGRRAIELLEPDGAGAIDAALKKRGRAHLFAGGVSCSDLPMTIAHLRAQGVEVAEENGQAFLNPKGALGADCPLVLSGAEDRPAVGAIDFLYEVTLLTKDAAGVSARFAKLFGLDQENFVPIASDHFDYSGVLTLFSRDDLHRFEMICPRSNKTTMGRYFERQGDSFYMCFAESRDLLGIERRAQAAGAGLTVDRPAGRRADQPADQMWVHPPALGGVMLGLSRPTMAWTWSGHPERVRGVE